MAGLEMLQQGVGQQNPQGMEQQGLPAQGGNPQSGRSQEQFRQKIREYLKRVPPEQIVEWAKLPAEDLIDALAEELVNAGIPEEDATIIAELVYSEILAYAQTLSNSTIEELQGGGEGEPAAGGMEQPTPSLFSGGQNG